MPNRKRAGVVFAAWCLAFLGAVLLILSALLRRQPANAAIERIAGWLVGIVTLAAGKISPQTQQTIFSFTPVLLNITAYVLLAVVVWFAVSHSGPGRHASAALTAAGCTLVAATAELLQILTPGRLPRVADCLIAAGSATATASGIWLYQWAEQRLPRLVNRETVSYVFFGVITTIVNILSYQIFYHSLHIPNLISNAAAWVVSVLVAYIVNKLFVFRSGTKGLYGLLREFGLFVAARLFSFLFDELGMWLMVDIAHLNTGVSKVIVNIIVVILNYFFSKRIIFARKDDTAADKTVS